MPNTHCLPSGSLGTGELPVPNVPGFGSSFSTVLIPGGAKRGVVPLFHGLGSRPPFADISGPPPTLYNTLATDLVADGWVVIWVEQLGDDYISDQPSGVINDLTNDTGHGSRMLTNQGHLIDHTNNYIQKTFGSWPVVPFGISYGGWDSLAWATTRTATITAYGGHVPVIGLWYLNFLGNIFDLAPKLSYTLASSANGLTLPQSTVQVNEDISGATSAGALVVACAGTPQIINYTSKTIGTKTFNGVTGGDGVTTMATNNGVSQSTFTSGLDISLTALNALANGQQGSAPLGFIGWETGDVGVGYSNAQILYNNAHGAGAPITSYIVTGGAHQMSSADVTAIMAWFTGTVDPICPAVH